MIVSRLLHAGYLFESAGARIAFDPVFETPFSTNCFPFPSVSFSPEATKPGGSALHRYDAVFLSHFHDDHCSLTSLDFIPRSVPIYLYCVHDELFTFIRALGFTVHSLSIDSAVSVEGFRITPRLALDPDVDAVFEICVEGLSILNVVDAWIDPSVLSLRPTWDLVLWPFQTMRELDALMPSLATQASRSLPEEWVEQLQTLRPRFVVPSSCQIRFEDWSWLNRTYFPISYAQFASEVASSVRVNPGESFELTANGFERIGRLPWIKPIGDQDVDYVYEWCDPPPMSEIAQRFPALTPDERAAVDRYCEGLDVTLYDHEGQSAGSGSTEVIAYKVYRAMTEGEQITSMYLRTDDLDTDEFIARLSADPLAFQRAQLKRLAPR